MKHYILLLTIISAFAALPAHAEKKNFSKDAPVIEEQDIETTRQAIVESYADAKGWCDKKPAAAKKGSIVIEWKRDKAGRCVAHKATVAK